jgi:hypothetical protein
MLKNKVWFATSARCQRSKSHDQKEIYIPRSIFHVQQTDVFDFVRNRDNDTSMCLKQAMGGKCQYDELLFIALRFPFRKRE